MPLTIFISYSHKDKEYLDKLKAHLKALDHDSVIDTWDDTRIAAGQNWRAEIDQALRAAQCAILLISADFLASDFIHKNELPPILEAEAGGLVVLPVVLKPVYLAGYPQLTQFQMINSPSAPISGMSDTEQDKTWVRLSEQVYRLAKSLALAATIPTVQGAVLAQAKQPQPGTPDVRLPTGVATPAIVFTHFGQLAYTADFADKRQELIDHYTDIIEAYLECNRGIRQKIGIVYVYIDWATKRLFPRIARQPDSLDLPLDDIIHESELVGLLRRAERDAKTRFYKKHPDQSPGLSPIFHYIGVVQLAFLVGRLVDLSDSKDSKGSLLKYLSGAQAMFGYDAPKFIEAVVRLIWTTQAAVVRIDEDVTPNANALDLLLTAYDPLRYRYYMFSSSYSGPDGDISLLNKYPVRVHTFYRDCPTPADAEKMATLFLAELSQMAAKQLEQSGDPRRECQVISGAGLIMYYKLVDELPPFMNMDHLVVWIDDHLKRRLHEKLGSLQLTDMERVNAAVMTQDRYNDGITAKEMTKAKEQYFDRLLRGCLFHDLIVNHNDFSNAVAKAQLHKITEKDTEVLKGIIANQVEKRYNSVLGHWKAEQYAQSTLFKYAEESTADTAGIQADDFFDFDAFVEYLRESRGDQNVSAQGDSEIAVFMASLETIPDHDHLLIREDRNLFVKEVYSAWVGIYSAKFSPFETKQRFRQLFVRYVYANHKVKIVEQIVSDAMKYIDLVDHWHLFKAAIDQMSKNRLGNLWLFEDIP